MSQGKMRYRFEENPPLRLQQLWVDMGIIY